ncbi:MAG: YihY/virulence factor BrkB family protein [Actinomycetota bacterium]
MPTPTTVDESTKVTTPVRIRRATWIYVLQRIRHQFIEDGCVDSAAALTFFSVLAIFPAGLAVLSLIGLFGDQEAVTDRILGLVDQVAPGAVADTLGPVLNDVAGASELNITLVISVAVALWSASIYVSAFGRTMNRIFDVDEGRPYWKRKPAQVALTLVLIGIGIVIGAVVVLSGPVARVAGEALGIGDTALTVWNVGKWPLLAAAVVLMVAVLYRGTGNVRPPRFRWLGLGALVAILVLGIASAGFAFYLSNFADYNRTFGTLAGVIIFLIWLFIINLALLLGAEFNAELERGRQLQAGIPAEDALHLSPRDTALIERKDELARSLHTRGVHLRRGVPMPPRTDTPVARFRQRVRDVWGRITRRR